MDTRVILTITDKYIPLGQVDDWGRGYIDVKKLSDWRSVLAIQVHALIEKAACDAAGIAPLVVTNWDIDHVEEEEPGDNPEAPYHGQHVKATKAEKYILKLLGLSWKEHNRIIEEAFMNEKPMPPDIPPADVC